MDKGRGKDEVSGNDFITILCQNNNGVVINRKNIAYISFSSTSNDGIVNLNYDIFLNSPSGTHITTEETFYLDQLMKKKDFDSKVPNVFFLDYLRKKFNL